MAEPEKKELTEPDPLDIMCESIRQSLADMPYGTAKVVLDLEKHDDKIKDAKHEIIQKIHHSR